MATFTPATSIGVAPELNHDDTKQFIDALFQDYEWQEGEIIAVRGLGEKGTEREGRFADQGWVTPDGDATAARVFAHVERWCGNGRGAFIVPAIIRAGARDAAGATNGPRDADIAAFTSVCLDLDNPETAEQTLAALDMAIGPASMVVESSAGKLHAYWLLNEAETDVCAVARVRHILALKSGGDPSFAQMPQVIRIPGSIHGKHNKKTEVKLVRYEPDCRHSFHMLESLVDEMFPLPWRTAAADKALAALSGVVGGGLKFGPDTGTHGGGGISAVDAMMQPAHAGGEGENTRWASLGKVIGFQIALARLGKQSQEEARLNAEGHNLLNLIPPFPDERFAGEWSRMWNRDIADKGPMPAPAEALFNKGGITGPVAVSPAAEAKKQEPPDPGMMRWAADQWIKGDIPTRHWLCGGVDRSDDGKVVDGLVRRGASHVLASEGGVGKTFALLDLAMKIAAPQKGDTWMGVGMNPATLGKGKAAVIMTAEDDMDELHIRVAAMDPDGSRRRQAGARLIIIPLLQAGGAFPLVEVVGGVARSSPSWEWMIEQFTRIPDMGLVAIDTVAATLHGEENAAIVLQQYVTALNRVQLMAPGCATMVTHHIRKQGAKDAPIQSSADMRNAIRGSNALLGAMRMVLGIWQVHDWQEKLPALGREAKPNSLFKLAVVKGNNPEVLQGEKTLGRDADTGGLEDLTDATKAAALAAARTLRLKVKEAKAWVRAAVVWMAAAGHPYQTLTGGKGLAGDRLPEINQTRIKVLLGQSAKGYVKTELVDPMVTERQIEQITVDGKSYYDARGGALRGLMDSNPYHITGDSPDKPPIWTDWTYHPDALEGLGECRPNVA
jgi:hypothetical protein